MSKNTKVTGKSNPSIKFRTGLNKKHIHRLITIEEFLKRVKSDTDSIFEDFDVKYAIEKLQEWCLSDNRELKDNAKHILQKAGLKAYIPKDSKSVLKKYKDHPMRLIQEVDTLTSKLRKNLRKRRRSDEEKSKAIKEVARQVFNKRIPESEIERIYEGIDPQSQCRNMAMLILADRNGVKFRTLFNLYYDCNKSIKQSIKRIKENPNSLDVNSKSFLHDYNQAYNDYLIKEHKTHEYHEISKRLQEALLPAQKAVAEISKRIEENFKPLRETLSKINFPNI